MYYFIYIFDKLCGLKYDQKTLNILFNLFIIAHTISIYKVKIK